MGDVLISKRLLFGWTQSAHGAKLHRRDKVRQDMKRFSIVELIGTPCSKKNCVERCVPGRIEEGAKEYCAFCMNFGTSPDTSVKQHIHEGSHGLGHYQYFIIDKLCSKHLINSQ